MSAAVRKTARDAAVCKQSASRLGYTKDQFIHYFCGNRSDRKPPVINRGYFARVWYLDAVISQFISHCNRANTHCSVVVVGSGFDCTFFKFASNATMNSLQWDYCEIDLDDIVSEKSSIISSTQCLSELSSSRPFSCMNFNIADISRNNDADPFPTTPGHVLYVFECVIVYLEPSIVSSLLSLVHFHSNQFNQQYSLVSYDMIAVDDPYTSVMMNNLSRVSLSLPGIAINLPSIVAEHEENITVSRRTMYEVYHDVIPRRALERISRLEMLDEVEELDLMMKHYAVTVLHAGNQGDFVDMLFQTDWIDLHE